MNKKTIPGFIICVLSMMLVVACTSKNGTTATSVDISLLPVKITQQEAYPGVESSLRSTRNYSLELTGHSTEEVLITHVIADSVLLPVRSVTVNGVRVVKNGGFAVKGANITVVISASRNFYTADHGGPEMEAIEYPLADLALPKDHVGLQLLAGEKVFTISAGEATTLESLFHP